MSFPFPEYTIEFKGIDLNEDDNVGQRYYQTGQNNAPRRQQAAELTAYHQTRLFRVIENNVRLYCGRPQCMTAEAACNQYRQYAAWKQRLPPQFKDVTMVDKDADPPLPHVVYLQRVFVCNQRGTLTDVYL